MKLYTVIVHDVYQVEIYSGLHYNLREQKDSYTKII